MIAQRVGVAALRRGAAKPNMFFTQSIQRSLAAGMSTSSARQVATTKVPQDEGHQILVNQRLQRPISPHLGIYKLSQSWFSASAWTRITGCLLSGSAYVYFSTYLIAPVLGWHLESASVAAAFAGLPFVVAGAVKFVFGFPFVYHFINGIRHLTADLGLGFKKAHISKSETLLWVSSILGGLYVAFGL